MPVTKQLFHNSFVMLKHDSQKEKLHVHYYMYYIDLITCMHKE